jgi:hypothetical protein
MQREIQDQETKLKAKGDNRKEKERNYLLITNMEW